MSNNIAGKTIVVVGGSSGIGYGVAKATLIQGAGRVVIASSSKEKVKSAVDRLKSDASSHGAKGEVIGEVVDAKDSKSVRSFFEGAGEIDHLVWTAGDSLKLGFPDIDLDKERGMILST